MRFTFIVFFTFFFTLTAFANNYEQLFSFNETAFAVEMDDLNHLEKLINDGKTEDALKIYFQNTPADSTDNYVKKPGKTISDKTAYYSGFVAGCIGMGTGYCFFLGPAAVLAVYLYCDEKEPVRQATKGCVVGSAIGGTVLVTVFTLYYLYMAGII